MSWCENAGAVTRRRFLRGLGTVLALPGLESMIGTGLAESAGSAIARTSEGQPLRLAFLYAPNGRVMENWTPNRAGAGFDLPPTLKAFREVQSEVQVLTGLEADPARAHGDGPGGHARANAAFLTGCHPRKTAGSDIRAGVSVDQIAAARMGGLTRLPSLELGCDHVRSAGRCDSGYACAYQYNLSWKTESTPMPPEVNPRLVFERLFGGGVGKEAIRERRRRLDYQRSVLDYVQDDARRLKKEVSGRDWQKIDEYLTSVREIEQQVEQAEKFQVNAPPEMTAPKGIPHGYREHLRMMFELLRLAFQTDSTRIATFLMAYEGSNRGFGEIGIAEGHHHLSHHQNNQEKIEKLKVIDQFYAEEVARFFQRLKETPEGEGNVLQNSIVVYGCGISDGNSHANGNLPILIGGRAGDALNTGLHRKLESAVPVTNLYLSLLDQLGVEAETFGDSTGALEL